MQIKMVHDLHAITNKLQHIFSDRTITDEEVAEEMNIPTEMITRVKSAFKSDPTDGEDYTVELESLEAEDNTQHDGVCMAQVYEFIDDLDFLKRDIVCRYHGLKCPPQSLQEISSIYMLSRERIRQIKREALDSIRDRL
jgi:DNA-directed RNA polymerase sigma subunit (sigma70/sigma32)